MKPNFFLFKRNGKKALERFDRTQARFITNGPNREDLIIDSLRLGTDVDYLGVVFLERFFGHALCNVPIVGVERFYGNDTWIIKFKGGSRVYEAFYSTRTRTGYVCNTSKVQIWSNGVIYRPLTDHQLMCLLQLTDMADNEKFSRHILARIINAIKGIKEFHSHDEDMFENEPDVILKKIETLKSLFRRNLQKKHKGMALIAEFREILG